MNDDDNVHDFRESGSIFYTSSCHCFIFSLILFCVVCYRVISSSFNCYIHSLVVQQEVKLRRRWKFCFIPKWHLYFSMYMEIWIYWATITLQHEMKTHKKWELCYHGRLFRTTRQVYSEETRKMNSNWGDTRYLEVWNNLQQSLMFPAKNTYTHMHHVWASQYDQDEKIGRNRWRIELGWSTAAHEICKLWCFYFVETSLWCLTKNSEYILQSENFNWLSAKITKNLSSAFVNFLNENIFRASPPTK
jgi:hypothetical protein